MFPMTGLTMPTAPAGAGMNGFGGSPGWDGTAATNPMTQGTPGANPLLTQGTGTNTKMGPGATTATPAPTGYETAAQPQNGMALQNTVANAYNTAVGATGGALAMNMGMGPALGTTSFAGAPAAEFQTYDAFTGLDASGNALPGFGAGQAAGSGYTAAQMGPVRDVAAGQLAGTDLAPYMNPYTQSVIEQMQADMERSRLIEQNNTNDAMTAAGAFGGSRHGIANAETNRAFYDRLGAATGNLRNLGFQNAQQAALQDIANTMQADFANQGMDFNVGAFNTGQTNEARRTGANNATQASIANANLQTQMAQNAMNAINDASKFGANAFNNNSQFNSTLGAGLSQFNAGQANEMSNANADIINTFGQNQFTNQMNAATQLANLSNLGFGMANTITGNQAADGATVQGLEQAIIDAAMAQFGGFTNAGNAGLSLLQSGVSAAPGTAGTTSSSSNPGVLGAVLPFL